MQWLAAHWQDVLVALLAIDAALVPIFPKVPVLVTIQKFLAQFAPKQ